jgi:hypothetical protein
MYLLLTLFLARHFPLVAYQWTPLTPDVLLRWSGRLRAFCAGVANRRLVRRLFETVTITVVDFLVARSIHDFSMKQIGDSITATQNVITAHVGRSGAGHRVPFPLRHPLVLVVDESHKVVILSG